MAGALGRRAPEGPKAWQHYEKYPLTLATIPEKPVPVVIGVNWYTDFDNPVWKNGRWWIGLNPDRLGSVRGGHCVCLEPGDELNSDGTIKTKLQDASGWYDFYDQGSEGACVGFGTSRMASLLNRKRYFARWLWDRAKEQDYWSDTNPGDNNGTSVDAAMYNMYNLGHVAWKSTYEQWNTDGEGSDWIPRAKLYGVDAEGISQYRWANDVNDVAEVLKSPANDRMDAVRILNSWGRSYPHRVWMPYKTLQRLINEDGEVALVTDR